MQSIKYPTTMFYELYVKHDTYHFVILKSGQLAGHIALRDPCGPNESVQYETNTLMTHDEINGLIALTQDLPRLRREAVTMTREYLQGASGQLDVHPTWGQMLFGMDLEDFDHI